LLKLAVIGVDIKIKALGIRFSISTAVRKREKGLLVRDSLEGWRKALRRLAKAIVPKRPGRPTCMKPGLATGRVA